MYRYFLVIVCFNYLTVTVLGNNVTNKYYSVKSESFRSRQGKLLSFNTEGEVSLDLDFNVPFISLPVRRSLEMVKSGSLLKINIGALALTGVILFGATFVLPALMALLDKKGMIPIGYPFSHRSKIKKNSRDESSSSDLWQYLGILDQTLQQHYNIDSSTCMQRAVCWYINQSSANVRTGNGSSSDKIIDGLATNTYLQKLIGETPIHTAVQDGLDGKSCSNIYSGCRISQESITLFSDKILSIINNGVG